MTIPTPEPTAPLLRTIDLRGRSLGRQELKSLLPRAVTTTDSAAQAVQAIITDVRTRGLSALRELALRFDGVEQHHPRVPLQALQDALAGLDPQVRKALEESIARARTFAAAQRPQDVLVELGPGAQVCQKWVPVRRVGLYVPGGLAVYPSSVVMNVVPAQAAGVSSIALASPPRAESGGLPHPTILAAAALLGVDEVHAIGGAQAIAAFAYGIAAEEPAELGGPGGPGASIEPVDVVTGPGNIFVATAKRLLKGVVGIDAEAGTTEIAILADATASVPLVAADLLSQAEHDPAAASVLITDDPELAMAVRAETTARAGATKHAQRVHQALSGSQSGIILVDDLDAGIAVCDAYAAEHLEIHTRDAAAVAARIHSAGAIFVGKYSPVSLGDYCAGSNHVLPTAGTAAFASGLNVTTFLRAIQVIDYNRQALEEVAEHVVALAGAEDLPAHGEAITARFTDHNM